MVHTMKKELLKCYDKRTGNELVNKKTDIVKSIFDKTNAGEACMKLVNDYTTKAFKTLSNLKSVSEAKNIFKNFGENSNEERILKNSSANCVKKPNLLLK